MVAVLWIVSVLSLLAIASGFQVWVEAKLTSFQLDRMREKRLCLAAVELAKGVLQKRAPGADSLKDPWGNNPEIFKEVDLEEGKMSLDRAVSSDGGETLHLYGLEDEEGRIPVNRAPLEVLKAVPGMTAEAAAAIVDWRDEDSKETPGGAEETYYRSLDPAYSCKNGALESVEELLLVRGVTPEIYSQVRPWLTVYGGGRVNVNSASETALAALGLSPRLARDIARYRRGEDERDATSDDRIFMGTGEVLKKLKGFAVVSDKDAARLQSLVSSGLLSVKSNHFRIHLNVFDLKDRVKSRYEMVLGTDDLKKEWEIKHWARL